MRIAVALLSGFGALAALLAGCGAQRAGSAQAGTAVTGVTASTAASAAPCPAAPAPLSRWREMTWSEYYMDVEERAWRRGGVVIWVDPPRVSRTARTQLADCR